MQLWEILLPTFNRYGLEITMVHHKAWDRKILEISNGLTLMHEKRGRWLSSNTTIEEKMVAVHIAATRNQMRSIAKLTKEHYEQDAVMYYKISDEVYFV